MQDIKDSRLDTIGKNKWRKLYYKLRKYNIPFKDVCELFESQNDYWPNPDWPLMPTNERDWYLPINLVPRERLK